MTDDRKRRFLDQGCRMLALCAAEVAQSREAQFAFEWKRSGRMFSKSREPIVLSGHSILIVEPEIGSFVSTLQAAIDGAGAETLVARDASMALQRCEQFGFSAALVNAEHRDVLERLSEHNVPALLYVRTETPTAIVATLKHLLDA